MPNVRKMAGRVKYFGHTIEIEDEDEDETSQIMYLCAQYAANEIPNLQQQKEGHLKRSDAEEEKTETCTEINKDAR